MHEKVKDLCRKSGVTIAQALRDCGIPEPTYYSSVYRDRPMQFETIVKLADYFNVPLDYFRDV